MFKNIKNESSDESDANGKWMNFVTAIHSSPVFWAEDVELGWFS